MRWRCSGHCQTGRSRLWHAATEPAMSQRELWPSESDTGSPTIRRLGQTQKITAPPRWIEPQLCKLVEKAPTGARWVHEIKFDGYRMAARIDQGKVQLLTRSRLDWTAKYPATAVALAKLPVNTAYIDGELCGVRSDGVTSFELMQQASDSGGDLSGSKSRGLLATQHGDVVRVR